MIVALDIVAHHTLRRDAWTAVAPFPSIGAWSKPNLVSWNGSRVSSRIGPSSFADDLKRTSLERPVEGGNAEGL